MSIKTFFLIVPFLAFLDMSKLFQPTKIGKLALSHRVVLPPLTRFGADDKHIPSPLAPVYYGQRASTPGSLLITEATYISPFAGGYAHVPGIWNEAQIREWKKVTDAVHAKGSFIFLQIWALGRAAKNDQLKSEDPKFDVVSASDIPFKGGETPRPLTRDEIQEYVRYFGIAADNAVNKAGFDGVEIHNANGYLLDQFLQTNSNKRTDEYGGSVENRSRFTFQVLESVTKAVGIERTAIRLNPWGDFQDMGMPNQSVYETFSHVVTRIRDLYPDLSYLHIVEPLTPSTESPYPVSNDFIHDIWAPRPLIRAGGFTRESAIEMADKADSLIAFGRHYIANPDLPKRLKEDLVLNPYDRSTFYLHGDQSGKGYTDYPFASRL